MIQSSPVRPLMPFPNTSCPSTLYHKKKLLHSIVCYMSIETFRNWQHKALSYTTHTNHIGARTKKEQIMCGGRFWTATLF